MTADDLVIKSLRQQADAARHVKRQDVTLNDLFRKYNV